MNSKPLLSFLLRPRTLSQIAEHLGIPVTQAERLVADAVGSGEVLVNSTVARGNLPTSKGGLENIRAILSFPPQTPSMEGKERLPHPRGERIFSQVSLKDYGGLLFKLRGTRPSLISTSPKPLVPSGLFGPRQLGVQKNPRQGSIALQMRLMEILERETKPLMELRASTGVSRTTLDRLVRRGLISPTWGSKGVGMLFKLTEKGLEELKRLRAASRLGNRLARKRLISLKTVAAH